MTKGQALQEWFAQFLTAYTTSSVPQDAVFPWLTYELVTGAWDSGEIPITVNLWYYTESEAEPNAKAQEIADAIGQGGVFVECDGGTIWIKRGQPWCQNVADNTDIYIKRRYLSLTLEYLTTD